MAFFSRRFVLGAVIILTLIVGAVLLRLGFEWRTALANIDSMIVTPVTLNLPTDAAITSGQSEALTPLPGQPQATIVSSPSDAASAATLSQEHLNILLLGTDARPGDETTRTDAMVLVHMERETGRVSLLSFPRDLWVSYPDGGEGRINAAYARGEKSFGPGGGATLARATVSRLLGLKVDHFVLLNFQGFKTLIDQLDGITVNVPTALYDPAYPTENYGTMEVRFNPGEQTFDGERALIYARTRHADNDFGRNQRQQLVLMAIFNRIRERGLLQQLTSLDEYTGALRGYVQTDLTRSHMLELANFARTISPDAILRYAIDSSMIVDLRAPATFAAEPKALKRIVSQFTGSAVSPAGGK